MHIKVAAGLIAVGSFAWWVSTAVSALSAIVVALTMGIASAALARATTRRLDRSPIGLPDLRQEHVRVAAGDSVPVGTTAATSTTAATGRTATVDQPGQTGGTRTLLASKTAPSHPARTSPRSQSARRTIPVASALSNVSGHMLRVGVALLGLQLSLRDITDLGARGLIIAVSTLTITFAATVFVARNRGNEPLGSLVLGAGFSVCGAAAATTMADSLASGQPASWRRAADQYAAATVALVSVAGLIAVPLTVWVGPYLMSLDDVGLWIGAAMPEVAHVVMAGDLVSPETLATATVAKLARVALLAPLVMLMAAVARPTLARRTASMARTARRAPHRVTFPPFVLGFLALVALRSTGIVPDLIIAWSPPVTTVLLAGAMAAIGLGIEPRMFVRQWRALGPVALTGLAVALTVPLVLILLWH